LPFQQFQKPNRYELDGFFDIRYKKNKVEKPMSITFLNIDLDITMEGFQSTIKEHAVIYDDIDCMKKKELQM
jgi:hypothetical protein